MELVKLVIKRVPSLLMHVEVEELAKQSSFSRITPFLYHVITGEGRLLEESHSSAPC